MSWNVDSAIQYLDNHAAGSSTGYCAKYTAAAIAHGGIHLRTREAAQDFGPSLEEAGVVEFPGTDYKKGDVVVIQPIPGHPHGHMAMYDGSHWVSDFKQRTLYPGDAYRHVRPSFQVYRHP